MRLNPMRWSTRLIAAMCLGVCVFADAALVSSALAAQPEPWQFGFQDAATPFMRDVTSFHNLLLWVIFAIAGFVFALLIYVMIRFNAKANPVPSRTSHNTLIEVLWTVVPVLILIAIAIPSIKLLYAEADYPKADLTIKATGNTWYWTHEYPDQDGLTFDSRMIPESDLKPGQLRLLSVDNEVVVPVDKVVRLVVTSSDVLHNWAMPAFGVKMDAVPGRLNEVWFKPEKTGKFYGQCSELCGVGHAFMPITVRVVSQADFNAWLAEAKVKFASSPSAPVTPVKQLVETARLARNK